MKKLMLFTVIVLTIGSASVYSQKGCKYPDAYRLTIEKEYDNALSFSFLPAGGGIGGRYDRMIIDPFGFYIAYSINSYRLSKEEYIHGHQRFYLGFISRAKTPVNSKITLGIVFNHYDEFNLIYHAHRARLRRISAEIGATGSIDIFSVGFRFDPFCSQSNIDIGINF